jgi:hypothetical protein
MGINYFTEVIKEVLEEKNMPKFFEERSHNPLEHSGRTVLTNTSQQTISQRSFEDAESDIRLRKLLKRAVLREHAPASLIEAIRVGIRK